MRLLFVCTSSTIFGAEQVSLLLLEGLHRRGHAVHAITSPQAWGDGAFQRRLDELGIPHSALPLGGLSKTFRWTPMRHTAVSLLHLPQAWKGFRTIRRAFRPDAVVVTSHRHLAALWPVLDAKETLSYVHGISTSSASSTAIGRVLDRKVRQYVAVSDYVRDVMISMGYSPEKICRVRNGVRIPDRCTPHRCEEARIGIVGQIAPAKGHDCLLAAARRLARDGVRFTLHIFGTGDAAYTRALQSFVQRAGLASMVVWRGYVTSHADIYESLDVCVVPSQYGEPFGNVAAEAAAWGVPVVATRRGGLAEIVVDGLTGYLVDPPYETALFEKLAALICDQPLRRRMGLAASAHVKQNLGTGTML